jgi:hypothetical protein
VSATCIDYRKVTVHSPKMLATRTESSISLANVPFFEVFATSPVKDEFLSTSNPKIATSKSATSSDIFLWLHTQRTLSVSRDSNGISAWDETTNNNTVRLRRMKDELASKQKGEIM